MQIYIKFKYYAIVLKELFFKLVLRFERTERLGLGIRGKNANFVK